MCNISAPKNLVICALIAFGSFMTAFDAGRAATYSIFYNFPGGRRGEIPTGKLLFDGSGNIIGATAAGARGGVVYRLSPSGKETVLFSKFNKAGADSGVIADSSSNLYGATWAGGNGPCKVHKRIIGCGTVYKLSPDGTESVLYAFQGGVDGYYPNGGLVADASGNLYGTTRAGGDGTACTPYCGIVFKIAPDGTETVLHVFQGGTGDGWYPWAGVILDQAGNLYGTTIEGGAFGFGTVFKVTPDGTESLVYSFKGRGDGDEPIGELTFDSGGNLLGTTSGGGTAGNGTVFRIAPDGTESVLYSFTGGSDGGYPASGLALDASGNMYGVTELGSVSSCGIEAGCGSVFELSPDGTETTLHDFAWGTDGVQPRNTPTLYNGNLFGSANGGAQGFGIIFEVTLSGSRAD